MSRADQSKSVLVEHPAELAHPRPELLQTAAAPKAAAPQAGSSVFGWISSKARSVGGACLHVLAHPGAGTLIFTSVCFVLAYQHRKTPSSSRRAEEEQPPSRAARSLSRSISFGVLQGGQTAMERLRQIRTAAAEDESAQKKRVSEALEYIGNELQEKSEKEEDKLQNKRLDFVKLYGQIGILEMSRRENEAIEVLKNALQKIKGLQAQHTHNAHEIELLLVEMLIFKGEYDEALTYTCLAAEDHVSPADPRVPLYKTIIHCLKNEEKEAEETYNKFKQIRNDFHASKMVSSMSFEVPDFKELKDIAKTLKEEFIEAQTPAGTKQEKPPLP